MDEYDGLVGASIFVVQLNAGALLAAHGQHCHESNLRPPGHRRVAAFDRIRRSCAYSRRADIVAVSSDGRAFKRVRIVIDASQYNPLASSSGSTTPPSVIIYRKDLTAYGWPFAPMISQTQFQQLVEKQQLPLGWLGTQLGSAATVGQNTK